VIRLRAAIFRGLRHPVLGPAVLLLLALLLALLLVHASLDHFLESGLICFTAVLAVLTVVATFRRRPGILSSPLARSDRAPPAASPSEATLAFLVPPAPLRL